LLQSEDALHGGAGLAKRLLDAQGLVPVLQQVGEHACGQLEPVVQRHERDLLPFPRAVGHAGEHARAEDRHVAPHVLVLQPLAATAIGQRDGFAQVAVAQQREDLRQRGAAQPQELFPDGFLDLVKGLILTNRPQHRRLQVREAGSQLLRGKGVGFR
jgi:hypothetical protein